MTYLCTASQPLPKDFATLTNPKIADSAERYENQRTMLEGILKDNFDRRSILFGYPAMNSQVQKLYILVHKSQYKSEEQIKQINELVNENPIFKTILNTTLVQASIAKKTESVEPKKSEADSKR